MKQTRVLFICMGNICRSPTAEGVFRRMVEVAKLSESILIDSAGTHAYHVGSAPDARAQQAALGRGYDLSKLIGRQVSDHDFEQFDYLLAMDRDNLNDLSRRCPDRYQHKLALFLTYSAQYQGQEVPDPYYGGPGGFDRVLDMVEDGARGLLAEIGGGQP
ncbi:MAG: phosphotyrosine protein phosphatase [Hydrogenophilales bacterium CG03_land_8_20_14_0_80_62_28]|nr:low molecular weight phosphotyrosine protein phosphatase [Betaproteobacteria bacterium]OIO78335.1 MAG: phosphotyrosine protein phosphatase [Hydrogenophilaceae bacterium CG1_02_62_390]PIV23828.1 MAG: phosphotyrosine protein phosphatase [Hydrogenophilales bacterium CG03_land_8_20_14_0_80_62_28]PIW38115.1 MAG: phosphotyrosine protein phosphatase [Hydrogenophilales bacterium CG15_BIG_FIL_POST_REV_8_21_14_020_62_31]PIW72324.1 MAG: phosphotyrosine protein phosphatase [Hydrogenophilales bacterium C